MDEVAQVHTFDKFDQSVNPFRTLDHLRLRPSFTASFKYFDLVSILSCAIPLSAGTSEKQTDNLTMICGVNIYHCLACNHCLAGFL